MTTTKSMNGGARGELAKLTPTDLELMLYTDGELDGERQQAVHLAIERDPRLRSKVAALRLASELIRDNAQKPAIDLTDGIMARISAGAGAVTDSWEAAPEPAGAKPAPIKPLLREGIGKAAPKGGASNDNNARRIFALAAAAVAVAAGMMLWGRMEAPPQYAQSAPIAPLPVTQEVAPPAPAAAPAPAEVAQEGDGEPGVQVEKVDFGSRMGAIFYVASEGATSNHTTTVVWLADDPAGGE